MQMNADEQHHYIEYVPLYQLQPETRLSTLSIWCVRGYEYVLRGRRPEQVGVLRTATFHSRSWGIDEYCRVASSLSSPPPSHPKLPNLVLVVRCTDTFRELLTLLPIAWRSVAVPVSGSRGSCSDESRGPSTFNIDSFLPVFKLKILTSTAEHLCMKGVF